MEQTSKTITLSASERDHATVLSVQDSGAGIPEDQLESIFIPFFSTKESGTGIGLSFSQHVMRLHQGRIRVQSTPEQGSVFHLLFGIS